MKYGLLIVMCICCLGLATVVDWKYHISHYLSSDVDIDVTMLDYSDYNNIRVIGLKENQLELQHVKDLPKSYNNASLINQQLYCSNYRTEGLGFLFNNTKLVDQYYLGLPLFMVNKSCDIRGYMPTDVFYFQERVFVEVRHFKNRSSGFSILDLNGNFQESIILDKDFDLLKWDISDNGEILYVAATQRFFSDSQTYVYKITFVDNTWQVDTILHRPYQQIFDIVVVDNDIFVVSQTPLHEDFTEYSKDKIKTFYVDHQEDSYFYKINGSDNVLSEPLLRIGQSYMMTYNDGHQLFVFSDSDKLFFYSLHDYQFLKELYGGYIRNLKSLGDLLYVIHGPTILNPEKMPYTLSIIDLNNFEIKKQFEGRFGKISNVYHVN